MGEGVSLELEQSVASDTPADGDEDEGIILVVVEAKASQDIAMPNYYVGAVAWLALTTALEVLAACEII